MLCKFANYIHFNFSLTKMDGSETVSDETNTHNHQSSPNDTENEYVPPVPDSERNGYKKTKRSDLTYTSTTPPIKVAKLTPRMTRSSHNPEFVAKQRKFLNRVHDPIRRDNSDVEYSSDANTPISTKQLKDPKNKLAEHKSTGGSEIKRKSDRYLTPKRHGETDEDGTGKKRRTKEVRVSWLKLYYILETQAYFTLFFVCGL